VGGEGEEFLVGLVGELVEDVFGRGVFHLQGDEGGVIDVFGLGVRGARAGKEREEH
jgi:hypothetical protein